MKKLIMLLVVIGLSNAAFADVRPEYSGSWYNPEQAGHGFSIEVISPEQTIVYWYTYDPDGNPIFLFGDGSNEGDQVVAQVWFLRGMIWGDFNPDTNQMHDWGTLTVTFEDCSHAAVEYDSTMEYVNGEPFGSGQIPLVRLASISGFECSETPVAGLYEGYFHSDTLQQSLPGFLAIAPNGEFSVSISDSSVGLGHWSSSGTSFSGSAQILGTEMGQYSDVSDLSMSGVYSAGYRIVGDYGIEEDDKGTFDFLANSALYRSRVSLAEIAGTYRVKTMVTGASGSLTLAESGSLSGSDAYGCAYAGELTLPDPQFNLLGFSITVTGCSSWNGSYRGYGAQIDNQEPDDHSVIRLIGKHEKFPAILELQR
jgi:hypothetical protein